MGSWAAGGPLDGGRLRGSGEAVACVWGGEGRASRGGGGLGGGRGGEGGGGAGRPYTMEWSLEGDELTFRHAGGAESHSLTIEPYRKIA